MAQTKIALFDLTGCEGCEFHLLSLNELLLDIFQEFEITNWRLLAENDKGDFDIAFIEGAATTEEHIKLLTEIRETSKIVVAIGACALTGNVFAELDPEQRKKLAPKIYDKNYRLKAEFLEPIEKFIQVDKKIPGCPPDIEKFKSLIQKLKTEPITSKIKTVEAPNYVAKIEGHGRLKINFQEKKAEFEVEESERLVEGLLLGKNFARAPFINSRICGICPVAHNLCSWKAIEKALGIEASEEVTILREILLASQAVKSHLLHLFFLVLPDYAGLRGSIELSQKYPAEFHLMLEIKRVSEKLLSTIAGSTAFPTNTSLGGFLKPPEIKKLLAHQSAIAEVIDEAQDLIRLFSRLETPDIKSPIGFLTTKPPQNYPLYQSEVSLGIQEVVRNNSTAKLGLLPGNKSIKVGALARMSYYSSRLNQKAQKALEKTSLDFQNPYHNNLAQAIEILHFLEEIDRLIDLLKKKDPENSLAIKTPQFETPAKGEACLEAPRGVLIHQVELTEEAKIRAYNIIPPTQINLASLEKEAQLVVQEEGNQNQEALEDDVEKLIRAFDPCITCAVH
jgi:sulfhydrogenase subunit alpha